MVSSLTPCYLPYSPIVQEGPHLDGIKDELLGAIGARLGALGALRGGMLGQQPSHHASTTLVLTVHTLLGAHPLMALKGLPTEVTATKLALEAPLGAVVLQVYRQIPAAQLGGAAIGAGDYIEAAGIQVTLVGRAVVSACQRRGGPPTLLRALPVGDEVVHSSGSPPHCECSG